MPGALITFVGVAHPWMCDTNGHVNVRHYMGFFDDASFQLLAAIVGDEVEGLGWADVKCEIAYRREIAPGTPLIIHSQVTRVGRTSVTYAHNLLGSVDEDLRAQAETVTVRFDLAARQAVELEPAARDRAEALAAQEA